MLKLYAMSGNESRSRALREYVFLICVLSCLTFENLFLSVNVPSATQFKRQAELSDNIQSMKRQLSHNVSTPQFLCFKCGHCNAEFESSRAYKIHRSHKSSRGTPCSVEDNMCELIHTGRRDRSTGNVQQIPLGSLKIGAWFLYNCK